MKAPFVYFGNKHLVAPLVWDILGDPELYIEPFAGALGVFLERPPSKNNINTEVLCDFSALITNIWRSCKYSPARTALYCCDGSKMADYHARHTWLMGIDKGALAELLQSSPYYNDPEIGGSYIWLLSNAIGSHPELENNPRGIASNAGKGVNAIRGIPHAGNAGQGVNALRGRPHAGDAGSGVNALRRIPHASDAGKGVNALRGRPHAGNAGSGVNALREIPHAGNAGKILPGDFTPDFSRYGQNFYSAETGGFVSSRFWAVWDYLQKIAVRLSNADIMIDSFENMLDNPLRFISTAQVSRRTNCAVFLDPPYNLGGDYLYGDLDVQKIHAPLAEWCINHKKIYKNNGYIRVALTCHEHEYDELLQHGWHCIPGCTINGMAHLSKDHEKRGGTGTEVIYLSPDAYENYLRQQTPLFMEAI